MSLPQFAKILQFNDAITGIKGWTQHGNGQQLLQSALNLATNETATASQAAMISIAIAGFQPFRDGNHRTGVLSGYATLTDAGLKFRRQPTQVYFILNKESFDFQNLDRRDTAASHVKRFFSANAYKMTQNDIFEKDPLAELKTKIFEMRYKQVLEMAPLLEKYKMMISALGPYGTVGDRNAQLTYKKTYSHQERMQLSQIKKCLR